MRIGRLKRGAKKTVRYADRPASGRNSVKLARLIRHDSNGGSGSFGAISHRNDRRARLRSGAQGDSDEEDIYGFVCSIDSGVGHPHFADARGRGMLWLRRRRWPAGRLCCWRNSRQRIGKAISICLLRACSGLLRLLWAGAVLWLLALAPRVPLSGVLSCDAV